MTIIFAQGGVIRSIAAVASMIALTAACDASDEMTMRLTNAPQCSLSYVPTGVTIAGDSTESVPDPIARVERNSKGTFYTAVAFGGQIAEWAPDGSFVRSLGRPGRGPGELEPGVVTPFMDRGDTVHVRDNALAWTAFSPTGEFVRRISAARMASRQREVAMLDDGTILSSNTRVAPDSRSFFHITDRTGALLTSFGPIPGNRPSEMGRSLAYSGGATFWAAEHEGSERGYVLEQWTTDGRLLNALQRDADWFSNAKAPAHEKPPHPSIYQLHAMPDGRLLVFVSVPNATWRTPVAPAFVPDVSMFDVYHEVIDPQSHTLVASRKMVATEPVAVRMFPGTNDGYMITETDHGLIRLDIVNARLVPLRHTDPGVSTCSTR